MYIREILRIAINFPSSKQVWVSPDDSCLLENDDAALAKYFVDMEEVHFLQWPPQMALEKKGGIINIAATMKLQCHSIHSYCKVPLFGVGGGGGGGGGGGRRRILDKGSFKKWILVLSSQH